jgi:hypothetical protein
VEPILPELLRGIRRIAYDPRLAPDDALRRIRDLISEHDQSEGGTSMTSDQTPPAGWYPDQSVDAPAGRQRYWDGSAWTEHTAAPTTAPPVAASTVPTGADYQPPPADQAAVQQAPRNGLGIAALILGIIGGISIITPLSILLPGTLGVIGVILGFLGRRRAMRGEATNKWIAERGIMASLFCVFFAVFGAVRLFADTSEDASVETGNTSLLADLEVGDCLADQYEGEEEIFTVQTVPCSEPHGAEIYAAVTLPEGDFPGDEALSAQAVDACVAEFEDFVGLSYAESVLEFSYLYPSEKSWNAGDRVVTCSVVDLAGDTTGTLADANR